MLHNPMALAGVAVVLVWVAVALLAPLVAPYDPIDQHVRQRLQGPSAAHLLGVDELGRDVFSRLLYGGRVSLPVAAVVVLVATVFGTLYGGLAGFAGKWLDEGAMRLVDMVLAFPSLILAMAIAAALGPSIQNSMLALLLVWWPPYARVGNAGATDSAAPRSAERARAGAGVVDDGLRQRHHHHRRAELPRAGGCPAHT